MNTATKLTATILALSAAACASSAQPAERVDEQGRTWVRLSDDEPLVPEIERRAEQAGCVVKPHESLTEAEIVCENEQLVVTQNINWLGFQCSSLERDACSRLVLSLSTDHADHGLRAGGSSSFGI